MVQKNSYIQITKTGDDTYAVDIPDLNVEEESVDGAQLLGILAGKRLVHATKEIVLSDLDGLEIGQRIDVEFQNVM